MRLGPPAPLLSRQVPLLLSEAPKFSVGEARRGLGFVATVQLRSRLWEYGDRSGETGLETYDMIGRIVVGSGRVVWQSRAKDLEYSAVGR